MRVIRLPALMFVALVVPFSRGRAQTCQGTAAFQDGRWRAEAADQNNSDFNSFRAGAAYGVPRSWYAGINFVDSHVSRSGPSAIGSTYTGPGVYVGYQIHLSDTPFQFCPSVLENYSSTRNAHTSEYGGGGSLGYRVGISDWFTLVPAAGIRWISSNATETGVILVNAQPGSPTTTSVSETQTGSEVFMTLGLVFNRTFTINPGVLVPSESGTKSSFTIGVSINWANAVSR